MADEGFHEIQLNGKQLVFLFITVTVVSVVIFLCGVLVGRGVRAERASAAVDSSVAPVPDSPEPVAQHADAAAAGQAAATTDPATAAPPPPADDELSYYKRLEGDKAPDEKLKPAPAAAAAQTTAPMQKTAPAARSASDQKPPSAAPAVDPGSGIAVQIAALRERKDADAMVDRLAAKGYRAYVVSAASGSASIYKVRVGNYKTEREAADVKTRLEKEEQFRPWIVR